MWRKIVLVFIASFIVGSLVWHMQVFSGQGYRVVALCMLPLSTPEMTALAVEPENVDISAVRQGVFDGARVTGQRAGPVVIFHHNGASLRVFEDAGGFVFSSATTQGPWEEWQGGSLHAGQLAQKYVQCTGAFPESLTYDRRIVHRQGLFVTGYTFIYRQWHDGYPFLGFGGLRVRLGNGSLVHMVRSLREVVGTIGEPQRVMSARRAVRIAVDNIGVCPDCTRLHFIEYVRLGYYTAWPETRQNVLEPVWEVAFRGHTSFIQALTGEILFGDGTRRSPR